MTPLQVSNQLEEEAYAADQLALRLSRLGQTRLAEEAMKIADALSSEAAWLSQEAIAEIKYQTPNIHRG